MKTKKTLKLLCIFLSTISLFSQQHICGFDHAINILENQDPAYRSNLFQTIQDAQVAYAQQQINKSTEAVLEIPVVLHIIYKNSSQNLSDARITNVMKSLNNDYQRMNIDSGNLRPIFTQFAGNAGIKFNVVHIERVATTETFAVSQTSGMPDGKIKNTTNGGSTPWNTSKYMNIWVCDIDGSALGGELLGYAYPPAGLSNWPWWYSLSVPSNPDFDGIVIDFSAFNTTGNVAGFIAVRGRTVTHEVGHYLGLPHIWGNVNPAITPDGCVEDDGIEDTPNSKEQSMFDCNTTQNGCVDTYLNTDWPDMVENYMDYSAETCMNTFTKGQIAVMRGVLANQRAGLLDPATTNVWESNVNNQLNIYPNPVSDYLKIQFYNENKNPVKIQLIDMIGKTIKTITSSNDFINEQFDVTAFENGVYFLQLEQEGILVTRKIIISK